MNLPRVSAFLLTYQHAAFVRESIDSILAQDYPNLEIVIGDDASTDGTQEILREYEARHPGLFRITYGEQNIGITANSLRTLRACTGEFIAHTSGDDVWLPGKLHKQMEWFAKHPEAVVCYGNAEHIDESGTRVLRLHHEKRRNPYRAGGIEEFLRSTVAFPTCSAVARASAIPPHGLDARVPFNSDWLYWAEIIRNGTFGYIPEVLARYRVHGNSAMRNLERIRADALLAYGILEAKYPELMPYMRRLREEFLVGSALQSLKQGDAETASRLLLTAIRLNRRGDAYASAATKAVLYVLTRTGQLGRVYGWYARRRK
ncbi:MAG TPA: glycosyltransferase [Thermoanaerobaculia bacterium]|jgi:glycosyltransferase involved in cell wall biosynthesis